MSLQISPSHTNQVSQWSSFEVYTWIAKHNDKLGLSQDDLDSIEESPLTGKQLLSKDDEQLSQEWAISIHSARKIVKKTAQMQRKAGKRRSEPIIDILNNGNLNNTTDHFSTTNTNTNPIKKASFEKTNDKASTNPSLQNIPEDVNVVYPSSSPKQYFRQSPRVPPFTPKYGSQSFSIGSQYQQYMQYQESLLQTKLTLTIKNDTFMARLSHPKWWMDGHFNHIPNKIRCKDSVSIDITGDLDTPLVGVMAFTLTLDPRYASSHHNASNGYAFSPFVANGAPQISPHIPAWMIGPGGLPYIPPSVAQLYELQQQYITKLTQIQQEKVEKKAEKKQQSESKKKRKETKKRMKEQAKQQRLQLKKEKRKLKREEKRKKMEQLQKKDEETKKQENDENINANANAKETEDKEEEKVDDDDNDSVIEKSSVEESDSSDSLDETDSLSAYSVESDEDELEIDEAPKYRLIILWSITPHKVDGGDGKLGNGVRNDRRNNVALNSMAMMSVASSDLLNQMNRFNVLLLQDDTDPDGPDEFNLDNSYFNELEQAALIADIEQCLVDNEHFEIAATFGTSPISNTYTLEIDIDDSLGEWPGPLQQFNSNNPFALGFIPTNMNPLMNPYPMMNMMNQAPHHNPYVPYTPRAMQPQPQFSYPDITMIRGKNKSKKDVINSLPNVLIPPKSGGRSRANSHPTPPVGNGMNGADTPSKMFTLTDVLSVSRVPENAQLPPGGASPITVTNQYGYTPTGTGRMQWGRRRKNSRSVRAAPRLSLWKEQIANLSNLHLQQQQNHHAKSNLYVPPQQQQQPSQQPQQQQNNSHQPPNSPQLQAHAHAHAQTLPVMVQYNIGDCVFVDDSKLGQIKSIGQHPAWGKGTYYGIRLTEKIGSCDGEYKGQRTFSCPPNYGYFVQRNQLTQKLKTTRFDFMDEDYIEDKKREFEKLKADNEAKKQATGQNQFAAEIMNQQQQESDDEDPGESDIPKPGTNVAKIMGQSSSERILSKSKPKGKYVPKFDKSSTKKEAGIKKNKSTDRRQRRNSKPLNEVPPKANPGWTGGAPRTIVVRNKIPPIKQHTGYLHCIEGVRFQQQMEWKKAIEKFKLGIALLEVSLMNIDRSMTKRKWKAQIEEFRHKMSRCTFEIQNNKRNRFIKKRDANAKKQVQLQQQAALQLQAQKMADAKAQVVKREDNWKVTREDMDKKIAENEIDPNYDPSTGIRPDSDDSDEVNSGRVGGDKALAKAKKEHRKKKKKKGKKGKDEDWSKYPGFENSGKKKNENESGSDDDKKKDSKISKHDKELRSRIEGDVMTADPDVSFGDVVGLANVKLALYETIILPYIRPDLFESVKKSTQGLLLFGPPGNGKTMIAKCVASECDATFFSISASSITSKFVGEAERIMRTLFTMARDRAPAIIFIDEIDSLLRARGGANEAESSRKIKTEFLIQFDGVKSSESKDKTITVIGATNLPDQLDNAVLRRFPKRIMVPNPDAQARYSLIRLLMSKHRHDLSEQGFRKLGKKTENYSCSDIAMLCSDAAMGPLRSMTGAILLTAKKSDIPKIAFTHFENSLLNVRASCDPTAIQHYFKWDEQFGSKLFLTMDVLPENMKQKPLLSVEEEKRKKNEAEHKAQMVVIEAQQEKKKLQQEKKKLQQEKLEKQAQEKVAATEKQSKLLKINTPSKEKEKPEKPSKLLKINAPDQKKNRRKSDGLFSKTKRRTGKHKSDDLKKTKTSNAASENNHSSRNSGSFNKPKVLNSKTFKISSSFSPPPSKHKSRSSSGHVDIPDSFVADKKRLWSKRSSKSGYDKKKKVKK